MEMDRFTKQMLDMEEECIRTDGKPKQLGSIKYGFQLQLVKLKGCWMGPWLVLVSPCFRENVVATCKIGSFLCTLDNLLQKNVIVLFFGNQISKWRSFEKRGYFWPTFHIFQSPGKSYKKSFSTYVTHIYTRILLTLLTFLSYQFWKKNPNLSDTVSLWYESWCWFLFVPFWNNQ